MRMGKRLLSNSRDTGADNLHTAIVKLIEKIHEGETIHNEMVQAANVVITQYKEAFGDASSQSSTSRDDEKLALQDMLATIKELRSKTFKKRSMGAMRLGKRSISSENLDGTHGNDKLNTVILQLIDRLNGEKVAHNKLRETANILLELSVPISTEYLGNTLNIAQLLKHFKQHQ